MIHKCLKPLCDDLFLALILCQYAKLTVPFPTGSEMKWRRKTNNHFIKSLWWSRHLLGGCVVDVSERCGQIYSARQKSWPVTHKFNKKSFEQCQSCLLLVSMYRGHKQCWYLVIPPSWIMISWTLVGMLIFLSPPDIGFLNLIWLRVLALWKPGPSSGSSQPP
jgi:hypothetical protein